VLVYLAALPWVYHEVYMWSVALALLVATCSIRLLSAPSRRRAVALGAAVACSILTRTTVGFGSVVCALLCAVVLRRRQSLADVASGSQWRWALSAALVPLMLACSVTWAKFGSPFNFLPLDAQVWTQINAHRRDALAANGGGLTNLNFLPTTIRAYFDPRNLRLRPYFPYITLPASPPEAIGGAYFDQTYRTGSASAFMPMLILLAAGGVVHLGRLFARGRRSVAAVPVVGTAVAMFGVLGYGYMANRYLSDLMPFLVVGSCIGLARLDGGRPRTRSGRRMLASAIGLATIWGVAANSLVAYATSARVAEGSALRNYVQHQIDWSPESAADTLVRRSPVLPEDAPADTLEVVGDCDALFVATGEVEEPWQVVGGSTLHAKVLLHQPVDVAALEFVMFEGPGAAPLVGSIETDPSGLVRVALSGLFSRFGPWMPAPSDGTLDVSIGLNPSLSQWQVSVADSVQVVAPVARFDDQWEQRYLVPTSGTPRRAVEWLDPHRDQLCERVERWAA
jgi:hypothetical protein